jgi:hypothetical protein
VAIVSGQRVYYSSTGGATWQEVLDSGTPLTILTAHWNDRSRVLYVGTKDRGIYRFSLGPVLKEKFGE